MQRAKFSLARHVGRKSFFFYFASFGRRKRKKNVFAAAVLETSRGRTYDDYVVKILFIYLGTKAVLVHKVMRNRRNREKKHEFQRVSTNRKKFHKPFMKMDVATKLLQLEAWHYFMQLLATYTIEIECIHR